ncbi:MAG TPA: iron-sulfur cluster assembly protein [Rectinemataceae bacterium]|nr:iron-sulfur cluster assembly protein [Rectinemataceae bacterium]
MDPEVKKKIDAALARVKEPQSNVPIVDLGLVGNVRYSAVEKAIEVTLAIGYPPGQCPACLAINGVVKQGIMRRANEEFKKEFPDFAIVIE